MNEEYVHLMLQLISNIDIIPNNTQYIIDSMILEIVGVAS